MNPSEFVQLLERSEFFSGLAQGQLAWLAEQATEIQFDDGQRVVGHGDVADRFFLILEGELLVEVPAIAGPSLEITRLGPGQVFGWSWLIKPYRWHFNARAMGLTRVLDFDGKAILARCEADTDFGFALLRRFSGLMGTRLEAAQRKIMDQWGAAGLP